jgi:hypothetical protein
MRGIVQLGTRRHLYVAIAAACLAFGLAMTALLAAQGGRGADSSAPAPTGEDTTPPIASSAPPEIARDLVAEPGAVKIPEPDEYAAAIGATVFGLDTRTSSPDQLRQRLRREADPQLSDDGRADLYATIDMRVPTNAMWDRLRRNDQWSQWQPTRTWEPAAWAQVVTAGHASPGWVMRNVTGVQTTHYVEDGHPRSTSREVTLSVVMRCPAEGVDLPVCRLVLISTQPVF